MFNRDLDIKNINSLDEFFRLLILLVDTNVLSFDVTSIDNKDVFILSSRNEDIVKVAKAYPTIKKFKSLVEKVIYNRLLENFFI